MKNVLRNEQGFVLITSLLMLVVLVIIGIAATNTTVFELQVSGNDKMVSQVFYRADAATREAMGHMLIEDLKDAPSWMLSAANTLLPAGMSLGDEQDAIHADDVWNRDVAPADSVLDNSLMSQAFPGTQTQMMIVHRGIAPGSSLDLGTSRIHAFEIYGRSQQNNSLAIVKTGFRNSYR